MFHRFFYNSFSSRNDNPDSKGIATLLLFDLLKHLLACVEMITLTQKGLRLFQCLLTHYLLSTVEMITLTQKGLRHYIYCSKFSNLPDSRNDNPDSKGIATCL